MRLRYLLRFALPAFLCLSAAFPGIAAAAQDSPFKPQPQAEKALLGTWYSSQAGSGLAKGEIDLNPHGVFSLKPEGLQPLNGYWEADASVLALYSPAQNKTVKNKYVLKGEVLTLTYPNGFTQVFKKLPRSSQAAPAIGR